MGWHKFLMKRGLGSPGYITKRMARTYRIGKENYPSMEEREVIRRLFVQRVAAQSILGGPVQYKFLTQNPAAIEKLVDQHPDLFSIITLAIFIEHPQLLGPGAPDDTFGVLNETVQEILDAEVPGWRTAGIWGSKTIVCFLCHTKINRPNPAAMYAATNEVGETEFLCQDCAPPLQFRAMSTLGFFMGGSHGTPYVPWAFRLRTHGKWELRICRGYLTPAAAVRR
ncbi:MAG: hypothetical protein A3J28_09800 [Acidobacteria bacterium RIFCSPLOWO2_12_FULL_60_22]|nr:MAG: hypothetical protein A3J28_09800 [Acidobacteria bacterium RIFCSPLOWO2_12_FULL_60_22]